ncbi:MAG: hypothetical protein Q9187_005908 [Circinaria calcarea]
MPTSSEFEKAAAAVAKFSKEPSNDIKLQLYSYFKQGKQDPPIDKVPIPTRYQIFAKPKYDAWKKVNDAGVTPAEAQKKYVELYNKLKSDYE